MMRRPVDRLVWTALGARTGLTRERAQREEILAAASRMTWSPLSAPPKCAGGPAARAVADAVVRHRRAGLRAVGLAWLGDGQQLIGLEDGFGVRSYVIDLGTEAIHLLTEWRRLDTLRTVDAADRGCRTGEPIPAAAAEPATTVIQALIDAYGGNTYRLLRDLADHLGASLAYVDRPTFEAHLERPLSDAEWAAIRDQFRGMDLDEHLGECGSVRTDWIETVLTKAGIPGRGHAADDRCFGGSDLDGEVVEQPGQ